MRTCRVVDLLYGAIPVVRWRGYLVRVHYDRCPACRARLAGLQEVRRLLVRESELGEVPDFWPALKPRLDEHSGRRRQVWPFGWAWGVAAAAAFLIVAVAGLWLFLRPGPPAPLSAESGVFCLISTRVADEPAAAYVYQPHDSQLTLIWVERNR